MDTILPHMLHEWIPFALLLCSIGVILWLCRRGRPTPPLLPRYTNTHLGTAHAEPLSTIETCVHGGAEFAPSETPLFVVTELPKLSFRHV
jgi:hypothetical protein